ncbi:glucose 1-dehydrogenase [Plantactinospora sp. B5E13]|uniref:SDR family NAD(P)-dependent oxidoreductase n=1 Tax=unclassified Plantactinospora TaxID=2631981 RepID=UPI00325DDC8D
MLAQRFTDRTVLVTGGGSGLGRAIALAFADEGATVVVAGRNPDPLRETVKLVEERDGRADHVVADVTRAADVARLVTTTVREHGGLHVAVNNAGVLAAAGPVATIDESEWSRVLATNLTGTWLSMKYELEHMAANGGGTIVNMSSAVGPHVTVPGLGAYGATKAAISALTRTAAREYIGRGVRVNAVSPGPCDTEMSFLPGESEAERAARMGAILPVGRVGTLAEIADAVLWLASPESGFTVGLDLVVDGGARA